MGTSAPVHASAPTTAPDPLLDRLGHVLATADGLEGCSDSLALAARTWDETYHLSPQRGNVLHALAGTPLPASPAVLEIGARCGGLTRHLGELGGTVDALEPDPAWADLARTRCADLPGVSVHDRPLDDLAAEPAYDLVVAVDALDLLAEQGLTLHDLATRAHALLRPGGVLLLAADNLSGVRYLAGDSGPSIARDGTPGGVLPRLRRADVESALTAAGLVPRTRSAFPDHRHTSLLLDYDSLAAVDPQLLLVLPPFPSTPHHPRTGPFPEQQLWASAVDDGSAAGLANSVVVVAGRQEDAGTSIGTSASTRTTDDIATFWTVGRSAGQSARNQIRRETAADGSTVVVVDRALAFPHAPRPTGPLSLRPHVERYVPGTPLTRVLAGTTSFDEARSLLVAWREYVVEACRADGPVPWDLMPRNVIVTGDGTLVAIDQEWQLEGGGAEDVLSRACFWLTYDLVIAQRTPAWLPVATISSTAHVLADIAGCGLPADWLDRLIDREADHMSQVWPADTRHSRPARARKERHQLSDLSRIQPPPSDDLDGSRQPAVSAESFDAVVEALSATNAALQQRVRELELEARHAALVHRDHAIGLSATAEKLRTRHEMAQTALRRTRDKLERAQNRNTAMRASTTWRIGSFFVRPFSRLRGR